MGSETGMVLTLDTPRLFYFSSQKMLLQCFLVAVSWKVSLIRRIPTTTPNDANHYNAVV